MAVCRGAGGLGRAIKGVSIPPWFDKRALAPQQRELAELWQSGLDYDGICVRLGLSRAALSLRMFRLRRVVEHFRRSREGREARKEWERKRAETLIRIGEELVLQTSWRARLLDKASRVHPRLLLDSHKQILEMFRAGLTKTEIAYRLGVSEPTAAKRLMQLERLFERWEGIRFEDWIDSGPGS